MLRIAREQQQLVVHNNSNSGDGIPAFSTSSPLYQATLEVQYLHNRAVNKLLVLGETWNFAATSEMSANKCNLPY